ncbi:hypothetical protein [Solirubrobacter soli]|uniref:hypothetical protein n=1 Tax=Solirubrobacter soli TaxID=363832 RepID=UPI0003F55902|nr:hypothetical protein [Solirubrobacter soli]
MDAKSRFFAVAAGVLAIATSLLFSAAAGAGSSDRNHDHIPDRWEKRHHLSLAVNQARRDQDHDGLNNRGEYKAGLDPRDDDSDNDGVDDGDENAGSIASFTDGVLTLKLAGGGTLTATVTPETEIKCDDVGASMASRGGDDDGEQGDGEHNDGEHNDGEHNDGEHNDGDDGCVSAALAAGRQVEEASLKTVGGGAVWTEIELGS